MRKLDDACVFFLASLPKDVFETVEKVFDKYSKGNLKGQTVKKGSLGMRLDLKGIIKLNHNAGKLQLFTFIQVTISSHCGALMFKWHTNY